MKFIKRLFEKRANLRNPPDWLYSAIVGGDKTVSGVTISPDSALSLSSYYAAVRAIAEDVAKLPLILYRRMEPRGKQRQTDHPLHRLLHTEPNPEMSAMTFRQTLTFHAIGWGNGYAEIVRNNDTGRILALWPLDPRRVVVERNDQKQIVYRVRDVDGSREVVLQAQDVLHIHGLGFDGLTGYSVPHLARESIGAALAAEKSGAALFGNSSRPAGILEFPETLKADQHQAIRRDWEAQFKGSGNSHKTAIFESGLTFKPIGIPNKDAQWIEARQFMVSELCRWLRIPPHKIAHLIDATYSNIGEQRIEYVVDTLQGWLIRWEQEIARKLIPPRAPLFAEHLIDGLLRGETKARYEAYRTAILAGWMSRNEARALENMNPAEGLDEFLQPLNTGPVGADTRDE